MIVFFYRCTVDSTTHIISQSRSETKFSFSVFEFQNTKDNVYIECNATFCLNNQNLAACNQVCHTKRSLLPTEDVTFKGRGISPEYTVLKSKLIMKNRAFNFSIYVYKLIEHICKVKYL